MVISLLNEKKVGVSSYPTPQEYRSISTISGKVLQFGKEIKATIHLYLKSNNQLIDRVQSDDKGNYLFKGLQKANKYFVISHHPTGQYNAVIQDNVVPK